MAASALGVVHAFLDRDRDFLSVLLIRIILFGAACFLYFFTYWSWPPSFQCCTWHSVSVACTAAAAFLSQG